MTDLKPFIATIAVGEPLSRDEAREAVSIILRGGATPAQLGAFLLGLRMRGETVEEIIGGAQAMRAAMAAVEGAEDAIDIVGTGGDGAGSYNVSTLAAIIVAGCGVRVAKHGGRAASSRSGASDVLGELGVRVGVTPAEAAASLREAGVCFMAAPTHHPALRHAAPARSELGVRSIFNLLGPLCNPARVERQLIGVYSKDLLEPVARALDELGSRRVWLVHGSDGLDELTTTCKLALGGEDQRARTSGRTQAQREIGQGHLMSIRCVSAGRKSSAPRCRRAAESQKPTGPPRSSRPALSRIAAISGASSSWPPTSCTSPPQAFPRPARARPAPRPPTGSWPVSA